MAAPWKRFNVRHTMIIKRNIRPLVQLRHGAEGEYYNIRVRVSWRGISYNVPTGIHLSLAEWDGEKVVGSNSARYNRTIKSITSTLEDIFSRYEVIEKRVPDQKELKEMYEQEMGKEPDVVIHHTLVIPALEEFIKEQRILKEWTYGTEEKFNALREKFREYGGDMLKFESIDDKWLMEFIEFLAIKKSFKNTTISKYLGFIRWFLRWARAKNKYLGSSHETFRPKLKGGHFENKEVIFLTSEELGQLSRFVPQEGEEHLERVRDVFLFACFSSLRFSDLKALKREYIHDDMIDFTTIKTYSNLKVNLNDRTRAILKKYEGIKFKGGLALPVISNQKSNIYLKELCRKVGIKTPIRLVWFSGNVRHEEVQPKWKLISFHAARRTFVTQGLSLGISTEVIAEWTGHSSVKAMKPYIKIVEELKKKEMEKFNTI